MADLFKAKKVSCSSQAAGFLDELAGFLGPDESMIVTYSGGNYTVEFEHDVVIDADNFPADMLLLLRRVS